MNTSNAGILRKSAEVVGTVLDIVAGRHFLDHA